MLIHESSERQNINKNWVKKRLLNDNFILFEFEGYTIKDKKVSGLFDRKLVHDYQLKDWNSNPDSLKYLYDLIENAEPQLAAKIAFSKSLQVNYRYVLYTYSPEKLNVYCVFDDRLELKKSYNNFCDFAKDTLYLRDLKMISSYHEENLPKIDTIMRQRCEIPWMGNLDAVLSINNKPRAIIEFQTTIKERVKDHCNNKWFFNTKFRKGDEQRWQVLDILAKQANLPLIILVWSPNEVNGDIKYKVVEKVNSAQERDDKSQLIGLVYKKKIILNYSELKNYLLNLD